MTDNIFPYQNLSLEDLPEEEWKSIPDFDGYYEISSFGRIKSLSRERLLHHGGLMPIREKILRQRFAKTPNKTVRDNLFTLIVTLSFEGINYYYSVGRLIYCLFVSPFDLKDYRNLISFKDGDGRNLHFTNLVMTNLSALKNKSYEQGRG